MRVSETLRTAAMRLRRAVGQEGRASLAIAVESEARASTTWAFANEADPMTGVPWPRRQPRGDNPFTGETDDHKILNKTGQLRDSIRHMVSITAKSILVMVSSSLQKAHVHMHGAIMVFGNIFPVRKKRLWWPLLGVKNTKRVARSHQVAVPARPFAGLTPMSRSKIKRKFRGLFSGNAA